MARFHMGHGPGGWLDDVPSCEPHPPCDMDLELGF